VNRTPSPDNSDAGIESLIQAKGLTHPRVTPADIDATIVSEHYFTAAQGDMASKMAEIADAGGVLNAHTSSPVPDALKLLTFCVLVLRNGFTVTGESACASPQNFDAEVGRRAALGAAKQKLWPLLGYALKERLAAGA
jgi:hypothetical protein